MTNKIHISILKNLIDFSYDIETLEKEISELPWDNEEELVVLTKEIFKNVLQKYINCQISNTDLVKWANLIEGREDIEMESQISEIIFLIANQDINGFFSIDNAKNTYNLLN